MTLVKCPCCQGTGRVELTGVYAETLDMLRTTGEAHAARLAHAAGCRATAMNQRLAALERLGAAASRRFGRLRLFRAVV